MNKKMNVIKRITIMVLLIVPLFAQLSIRAQYMQYSNSGREWEVDLVAEYLLNGRKLSPNELKNYYFEWHHVYNGRDEVGHDNGSGKYLQYPDGEIEIGDKQFYDVYLLLREQVDGAILETSNTIKIGRSDFGMTIYNGIKKGGDGNQTVILARHLQEWYWRDRYTGPYVYSTSEAGKFEVPMASRNDSVWVSPSRATIFRADTNNVDGNKFHHWENWNTIENYNSFVFNGAPVRDDLFGIYHQVSQVTIQPSIPITGGINIIDPWHYEDSGRPMGMQNRGMDATPHPVNGQVEVFLGQGKINNPSEDFIYKLVAEDTPQGVFSHWKASDDSDVQLSDPNSRETYVVFLKEGVTVTAEYIPVLTGTISGGSYPNGLILHGNVQINGSINVGRSTGQSWPMQFEGGLTIKQGTAISFNGDYRSITVYGDLNVEGTSTAPVTITGNYFYGLNTYGHLDISYLNMSGGTYGLLSSNAGGVIKHSSFSNHFTGARIWTHGNAVSILNSTFSNNTSIGLYAGYSDEVNIAGSTFENNDTGLLFNRSSGRLRDNDFTDNSTYGAWFYNRSSGDLAKQYINGNTKNNRFDGNGVSGSFINEYSYPLFGLFFYSYQSGYNTFSGISGKDIKAENTGWIWAQNNWWEGPPNVSGNVMVYPTADDDGGTMPAFKSKDGEIDSLTQVVFDADSLIADSLYDEGLSLYQSVISSFPDDTVSTMALSRLYTLIPQLREETELYTLIDEVHTNHAGTLTGRTALFMDVALTSKTSGLEAAIDQSQSLLEINEAYDAGVGEKAAALLQHSDLLTQKETLQNVAVGKVRDPHQISEQSFSGYETIAGQYSNTGAAEIVSLLYGIEKPNTKDETIIPDDFTLFPAYPNPFNPSTSIKYYLPEASEINLTVYNLLGEEVKTLSQGHKATGFHHVQWNGENQHREQVPSGMYFYTLRIYPEGNNQPIVKHGKMVMLK